MNTPTNTQQSNKPVASFKEGLVSSAVWSNASPTNNAKRFFSVSFQRSYSVEGPNGTPEWKHTTSMNPRDLPALKRVIRSAEDWIANQPA